MYPLGHFAISYFLVNFLKRFNKEEYNLPLVLIASVLPDIDIIFHRYIVHRGPTHSIITMTLVFIPVYLYFRKGIPYYVSLLSHSLIGDYFTAYGTQLFWPFTDNWYRAPSQLMINGGAVMITELSLFILMLIHLIYTNRKKKNACGRI
jgi:membrane-bound metal-dependent hydrolase YbcI (DUF457 family)